MKIGNGLQQPAHFGGGKQGRNRQPGDGFDLLPFARMAQLVAKRGAAGALPGDGGVNLCSSSTARIRFLLSRAHAQPSWRLLSAP